METELSSDPLEETF